MNLENYFQDKLFEYDMKNSARMIGLYEDIPNQKLKQIFSIIHFELNKLLKYLQ